MGYNTAFIRGFSTLLTILISVMTGLLTEAGAQTINPQFISISDGLASTQVQAIHQDRFGLLWIGTTNGQQKYDGTSFKTYKTEANRPNSLISNDVWGIVEEESGDLWVATRSGISMFYREKDAFTNYDFNEQFNLPDFDGGWVNAFDAMREKVNSEPNNQHSVFTPKLTVSTKSEKGKIIIGIENNGPGIPDDIQDKILQPFFTTKKGTQGTGLGLSITNDIVKAHGGSLQIESTKGEGSKFIIILNLAG